MDRLVRAVVTGLAVGLCGTILARFVLGIVTGLLLMSVGAAPNDQTLSFPPFTSSPPEFLVFIVEFAFSMLGGFVAGKRYPPAPTRAALYVGVATCAAVVFRIALTGIRSAPVGSYALECAAPLLAACLGGALALRLRRTPDGSPPVSV